MRKSDKKSKSHHSSQESADKSNTHHQHDTSQSNKEVSGYFYSAHKRDPVRERLEEAEAMEAESEVFDFIEVFYRYGQVNQPSQLMLSETRLGLEGE